jgi:hypothetical protein
LLEASGFGVEVLRERLSFVEALVSRAQDTTLLQWVRDSAYRFFPLVEHELFGLALHPFDLATNKVLALVGRLEVSQRASSASTQVTSGARCRESLFANHVHAKLGSATTTTAIKRAVCKPRAPSTRPG